MEFWKVTNSTSELVEIDIYGDIGEAEWWRDDDTSMSAKKFLDMVRDAKGKAIDLHVNSGGGSVFDAFAMMTALAAHDKKVTAYVDGIAASAASFLLAGADEVRMSSVAYIMIHNASTFAWGNAAQIRETADWLENIDHQLAGIYAKRGTKTIDEFAEAMEATTWFTADDALEWGLIDFIDEAVAAAACLTDNKAVLDSAPSKAAEIIEKKTKPIEAEPTNASAVEPAITVVSEIDGQEPVNDVQEHFVVIDGCIYRTIEITD